VEFLDVKTDYAFKKVFGSEQSKEILISFLNSILDFESNRQIVDLDILDPYNVPALKGMKDTFVDVKAKLKNDTIVIIEMQVLNHDGFEKRILYNIAKNYSQQLQKGEDYNLLNPVIALTIVNFEMFEEFNKYKSIFQILEKEHFTQYKNDIELVFIELPKFKKSIDECKSIEDKWIYFIKNSEDLTVIPKDSNKEIKTAYEIANLANYTIDELELQRKRKEFIYIQRNSIQKAKRDGHKEGLKEGLEQGLQQGKIEEKIQIAKVSLAQGIDINTVALITSLDIEDIKKI
jgi:predicted transposase/invertase (TIGR01784 family)